jgi:hypothetical protein
VACRDLEALDFYEIANVDGRITQYETNAQHSHHVSIQFKRSDIPVVENRLLIRQQFFRKVVKALRNHLAKFIICRDSESPGPVAELVGIEGGVVSGVFNLESSGVEAPDRRPRHEEHYHEA